ncbi:hypothetical protein Bca52824_087391 [Brassica carinata]|uniref:Uncharacterized protein n=1 Tax=Brassica carinata TaxID=52824 RepID=A0A8X7PC47_BRACI|nr:hypothetical protein Bca52824_087391 [Brassica carinata]
MQARMDTQQQRLDSLEGLLDVMAVGNPTLQRALAERRAALGMSQPDPEAGTSTDPNPSANYFDDDDVEWRGGVNFSPHLFFFHFWILGPTTSVVIGL